MSRYDEELNDLEQEQINERKRYYRLQNEAEMVLEEVKEVVSGRSTSYAVLKKAILNGLIKIEESRES